MSSVCWFLNAIFYEQKKLPRSEDKAECHKRLKPPMSPYIIALTALEPLKSEFWEKWKSKRTLALQPVTHPQSYYASDQILLHSGHNALEKKAEEFR